ncbi:MAG: tetratricopeptide repeat protein [Pyrinomonadaceae bacterium]
MRHLLLISHILLLSTMALAQGPTRSQQLNRSVAELYQKGKFDEAIPIAEEIVEIEQKAASHRNLVNALENLSRIKIARFKQLVSEFKAGKVEPSAVKAYAAKLNSDAEGAENDLRQAIKIADANPAGLLEQRVAMRNSLAWLLYYYRPNDPEVVIAFDKFGRDKFEMKSKAGYLKRLNEAESLNQQGLKIATEADADSNLAMLAAYNLADLALATGDLEKAADLLEKCIADVERVLGKKSPSLVQPIELYIKVLTATDQDDLAFEMLSRLVRVTGKSAGMPKNLVDISLRADKAFAPINSSGVETNAMVNKDTATLAGRSATFNGSFEAMLAVSTHGRQYYNSPFPANINKVPVRVLVDETGNVLEAEAAITDKDLKSDAEKAVREWKFKPFESGGQPRKMKGYVVCTLFTDRLMKRS